MILRETEQRIEIVRNLMSGDRRKVVAAKLMRNGVFATQGLYTPVQQLMSELTPNNKNSSVFYNRGLSDYNKPLVGGDIDDQISTTTSNIYGGQPPIVAPGIGPVPLSNNDPVNSKTGGTRVYN